MKTYVILHNIRSAHNVGSIFRSADGAGVAKIFITGYTPAPIDRFGREQTEILKTSLGATHTVPYEIVADIQTLLNRLRAEHITIVAVEQTPSAFSYTDFVPKGDVAFIFGNEVTGVEPEILAGTDVHLEISMRGKKESLNVSVCVGIILFQFREQ